MNHSVRNSVLVLFLSFGAALSAHAQGTAQFQGRITDPQQGVVAGAEVHILNQETNVEQKVMTNKDGLYTAPFLMAGTYVVTVQATGFATASSEPLILTVGQTLSFDAQLKVGSITEQVIVNAGGLLELNTTDATVSTVIDPTFVQNIPLNGRSFQDLISITPGVITTSPNAGGLLGVSGDFSINGQRTESNSYIVDGVSANFSAGNGSGQSDATGTVPAVTALGTSQALMSVDDLQEFRVLSSTYSAEYGRATGGQITFATRSGTNDPHGNLFEYLRNDILDANNWFNDYLGAKKPPLRQSDFGGTFGAPVRIPKLYNGKDKTFFFVSYEGVRLIQPKAASVVSVPDLNLRANTIDGAMKEIVNAMPLPNLGVEQMVPCTLGAFSNISPTPCPSGVTTAGAVMVPSGLAEFAQSYSVPSTLNSISVRLDHNITSKMSVFFRFSDTPSVVASRPNGLSVVSVFHSNTLTYTAGVTNQISSNVSNSFRLGYGGNQMVTNGYVDSYGGNTPIDYDAVAGIAGYSRPEPVLFLQIPNTIGTPFTLAASGNESYQWNIVDTISVTRGHHQLKFGFDYRRVRSSVQFYDPLADAIVTNVWQIQNNLPQTFQTISYKPGEPLFHELGLFAQDEWRVTPRLSLSLGLRWDLEPPPTSGNGQSAFTLSGSLGNASSLTLAPRGTPLWNTSYFNFAPRLGVAYQVRTKQGWGTVLRAGGGVFFDSDNWLGGAAYQGIGFSGSFACTLTCGFPYLPSYYDLDAPKITAPYTGVTIYDFPEHMQLPYSLQWNFSVQQSLGAAQSLTLSYVGASARRLPNLLYLSLTSLNPQFGTVISAYGGVYSNYNSLQASFQRKLSHGVQVLASYDLGHLLDNKSEGLPYAIGARQYQLQYGASDLDVRHNFVAAVSWDIPGVNHDSITRVISSHWGVDARFTDRTAFPVNVSGQSTTDPTNGIETVNGVTLNPGVPLYLYGADCDSYYISHGNPQAGRGCPGGRGINPAAFSQVLTSSSAPKGIVRGFGENQINLAVRREFPIRERLKLQFRGEIYNIFNHPNFGAVNSGVGSSNFGLASATLNNNLATVSSLYQQGGPRNMQFALKLLF